MRDLTLEPCTWNALDGVLAQFVGHVIFAKSQEHLEDQADVLDVDPLDKLLNYFGRSSCVLRSKVKLDHKLIDALTGMAQETSCEVEILSVDKGLKSNMKILFGNSAINSSNGLKKVTRLLELSKLSVYRRHIVKQGHVVGALCE